MNLDGLSSSLHQGLIPPSRIGNITTGAWKHTHTNTELTFFFPREGKSCLVEHTKIGEVWGNSKKTWWERWCGDVGTWRRLGEKIQMNLCPKISWRLVIYQHKRPFRNAPFWMLYLSNLGLLLVFMLLWRQACPLKSAIFRNVPKYSYIHIENVCALSQVVAMLATSWPQLVKMLARMLSLQLSLNELEQLMEVWYYTIIWVCRLCHFLPFLVLNPWNRCFCMDKSKKVEHANESALEVLLFLNRAGLPLADLLPNSKLNPHQFINLSD